MKCILLSTLLMWTVPGAFSSVGEDMEESNHPLYLLYLSSSSQSCMGTLIAPQWVITAAHCFLPELQVTLHGDFYNIKHPTGEILPYEKIIIHPNFTVTSPQNDIMLIKLTEPLIFFYTLNLQLPSVKKNGDKPCLIYTLVQNKNIIGDTDNILYTIKTWRNPGSSCQKLLGEKFLPGMFCIGFYPGNREQCQVVSAAPAICGNELQGIMSWETGCVLAKHITVFTDLYSYVPWIENNIYAK